MKGPILFIFILFSVNVFSQKTEWGIPLSVSNNLNGIRQYELLPAYSNLKKAAGIQNVSDRLKKLEFAHVFDTDYNPSNSGEWFTAANGDRIWRLGVISSGAFSLNIILTRFHVQAGIKLFVYSPTLNHLLGAYTSRNNSESGLLAIQPLPGDSMILEMDMESGIENYGELTLGKIGHDYLNITGKGLKYTSGISYSGSCNVDINCNTGADWQQEKHAVCKMIINAKELCTGTLINNTANDKTPYLITANHCIDTLTAAQSAVFIFNYEKWKCGGIDGPIPLTLSGSELIATTKYLDFSLVKLGGLPAYAYKPYFAGWDRSGNSPVHSDCIHHPNGDVTKISQDNDAATQASYPNDYDSNYLPNTHWLISKWDIGTTEKGSSGAPLFDQNHRFIGDLTGGDANCTASVDDYFARFANSWSDLPDQNKQLKYWLDPINSEAVAIDGLDPYQSEKASCDTLWNIADNEKRILYNTNLSWGYMSGQNSSQYTQFAEKIDVAGILKIPGFYLHVAKAYYASSLSYITIKLWKDGAVPGKEITTRSFYLKDLIAEQENYLEFDSIIFTSGPIFIGYSVNYSASQDTFAVYQAKDRGSAGISSMYLYKDGDWKNVSVVTSPAIHSALGIGLISCGLINGTHQISGSSLKIYPNPVSNGILSVELPVHEKVNVKLFSMMGKPLDTNFEQADNMLRISTSNLVPGMYILKIACAGKEYFTAKFTVQH